MKMSSPAWGRGLKSAGDHHGAVCWGVVPRVGTWIEIYDFGAVSEFCAVVPRVGTWIEILYGISSSMKALCRPPRGDVD